MKIADWISSRKTRSGNKGGHEIFIHCNYLKEDHRSCELPGEELFERRSSQLYTHLMQLRKESLKKKKPIQRPAPSWLVSLIGKELHRYRRGEGLESRTSLIFFSGFLFATA